MKVVQIRDKNQAPTPPKAGALAIAFDIPLEPVGKSEMPTKWIQVLPVGMAELRDSREPFEVSRHSVASILYYFGNSSVELAVDYDHGMFNGDNPLAAGWGERLLAVVPTEWRDSLLAYLAAEIKGGRVEVNGSDDPTAQGIFLYVRWTEEAAARIAAREYRYISPVVFMSYAGDAEYLWNVALTNAPAIDGMQPLAASLLRAGGSVAADTVTTTDTVTVTFPGSSVTFSPDNTTFSEPTVTFPLDAAVDALEDDATAEPTAGEPLSLSDTGDSPETGKEQGMNEFMSRLAEFLGLSIEAEDFAEQAMAALAALREQVTTLTTERDAVAAELETMKGTAAEATANAEQAAVKVAEAEQAAQELTAQVQTFTVDKAVSKGLLAPSARAWALEHFDAFEALVPALKGSPQGPPQGQLVTATNEPDTIGGTADNRKAIAEKIKTLAAEKGIPYSEAYTLYIAEHGRN